MMAVTDDPATPAWKRLDWPRLIEGMTAGPYRIVEVIDGYEVLAGGGGLIALFRFRSPARYAVAAMEHAPALVRELEQRERWYREEVKRREAAERERDKAREKLTAIDAKDFDALAKAYVDLVEAHDARDEVCEVLDALVRGWTRLQGDIVEGTCDDALHLRIETVLAAHDARRKR